MVFQIKNVLEEPGPAPAGQGPQFVVVLIRNAIENDRIRFRPANDKFEHATLHRHTIDYDEIRKPVRIPLHICTENCVRLLLTF